MAIPNWAPRLREALISANLEELYKWWQLFKPYIMERFDINGDITLNTGGKGVVLTNAAGTVTKRIRLNDAGDGLIYEDV
jgi:hypothetical protein